MSANPEKILDKTEKTKNTDNTIDAVSTTPVKTTPNQTTQATSHTNTANNPWPLIKLVKRVIRAQNLVSGSFGSSENSATASTNPTDSHSTIPGGAKPTINNNLPVSDPNNYAAARQLRFMPGTEISLDDPEISLFNLTAPLEDFPELDNILEYNPPISVEAIVSAFVVGPLKDVLSLLTFEIRAILAIPPAELHDAVSKKRYNTASTIFAILTHQSQLHHGFQRLSEFIRNPVLYKASIKNMQEDETLDRTMMRATGSKAFVASEASAPVTPQALEFQEAIHGFQKTADILVKKLIQRIDWLWQSYKRENVTVETRFFIELLGTDTPWIKLADAFIEDSSNSIISLMQRNQQACREFNIELKEFRWPHGAKLRKEIESKFGFTFMPRPLTIDRIQCDGCGVDIGALRPWHNLSMYHNFSRHSPEFRTLQRHPGIYVEAASSILITFARANPNHPFLGSVIPLVSQILNFAFCLPGDEFQGKYKNISSQSEIKDNAENKALENTPKPEDKNLKSKPEDAPKDNPLGTLFTPLIAGKMIGFQFHRLMVRETVPAEPTAGGAAAGAATDSNNSNNFSIIATTTHSISRDDIRGNT